MSVKSVIEIDVNDDKFKAFQAAFDRYQKILNQQSKKWEEVNKVFDDITKKQKNFSKAVRDSEKGLKDAVISTGNIARNMASAALSAAKWVAFGAIGSGFGLGGIASSASDYRRQALGLGISTGQLRSANLAYGRVFNPESALSNIANIQNDPASKQILARLGGQTGQNPADQLGTVYRSAIQQFKQFGQNPQFAEALGLTKIFSLEDLRRGANMTAKELNELDAQFKRYSDDLKVSDSNSKAWQDFWYELKKAGNTIETSIIKNLADLTPELQKLTKAVAGAIDDFLSSKQFKEAITDFTAYLSSPEGKQAIADFFEGLKDIAAFIGTIVGKVPDVKRGLTIAGENLFRGGHQTNEALRYFMSQGFNQVQATGMVANLQAESGLNPNAIGDSGKAYGIGQWHPDRQADFEAKYGHSIKNSTLQEQLDFVVYELTHKEQNALAQFQKAKSIDEAVRAGLSYERPAEANRDKDYKTRMDIANSINVKVFNSTGGNANTTVQALPGVAQ